MFGQATIRSGYWEPLDANVDNLYVGYPHTGIVTLRFGDTLSIEEDGQTIVIYSEDNPHEGLDIATPHALLLEPRLQELPPELPEEIPTVLPPLGAPIRSSQIGRVIEAGGSVEAGFSVLIEYPFGYRLRLVHLQEPGSPLEAGDHVFRGRIIGREGNTGLTVGSGEGIHLHMEAYKLADGVWTLIDPELLLDERLP